VNNSNILLVPENYTTIEAAVNSAVTGDIILVNSGIYSPAGGRLIINKSITIEAEPSLSQMPIIKTNCNSWTNCAIQIDAPNVVIRGIEIDNSAAGNQVGYIVGDWGSPSDGWIIDDCSIHDGDNAIRVVGNNVTIENCNLYNTSSDLINCEYGNCFGLQVINNFLHSENPLSSGKPAGITYSCSNQPGADVNIAYNYCCNCRTFIDFQNSTDSLAPLNKINVFHNTVDFGMSKLPAIITNTTPGQLMSIAWWSDTGNWNGPNFDIKDNIFSRQKWYEIVDTDSLLRGTITLNNNLFYAWYLCNSYQPEDIGWPEIAGAVGWYNMGVNTFNTKGNLQADPMYQASGSSPASYYALNKKSPALGTATDGLNIGAWQNANSNIIIKNVSPGKSKPGSVVTITGSGFKPPLTVYFGTQSASISGSVKSQMFKCVVPAGYKEGDMVDVTIKTLSGKTVLYNAFMYTDS